LKIGDNLPPTCPELRRIPCPDNTEAQGIAKLAGCRHRESLYRALSIHDNSQLSTLVTATKAIGLRLAFSFRYDYRFPEQLQFVARDRA
jgi:hypothetical protein